MQMTEQTTVNDWVAGLKNSYPNLPETLTLGVEKANLVKLKRWFSDVKSIRDSYTKEEKAKLSDEFPNELGKRQIIPVLASLDNMTPEEIRAWHELFVCLSANLANIGHRYWKVHQAKSPSMGLEDILNYLPIVFLYILSSYKEYPPGGKKEHADSFRQNDDGRVKLITWVNMESRRHVKSYIEYHATTVRQGSGFLHRLKQTVASLQNTKYASTGQYATAEELADMLDGTHQGSIVSKEKLVEHIEASMLSTKSVSLSDVITSSGSNSSSVMTYEDTMSNEDIDLEGSIFDPVSLLENRIRTNSKISQAVEKLLHTESKLTITELAAIQ